MRQRRLRGKTGYETDERLLMALAEQLKMPFLQIARRAELATFDEHPAEHLAAINLTADTALRLLDSYLLSIRLARSSTLELEPVAISAVLQTAAHELSKVGGAQDFQLEVHVSGRYEPVLAHRAGLEAALVSLGHVFMASGGTVTDGRALVIKLGAHRGKTGIVAGLFANVEGVTADMYRRAHHLYGQTRMAMPEFAVDSGAGVFIADALLGTMSTHLRVARHQTLSGLGATLLSSRQLRLV